VSTTAATPVLSADLNPASSITPPSLRHVSHPDDPIRYEDKLLTRRQVARWLGVTVQRLNRWAAQGYGPPRLRIGGYRIAYRLGSVLDFVRAQSADVYPDVRRKAQKPKTDSLSQV
jgi:predicted DNA-binding transcriptional regulator AlpA